MFWGIISMNIIIKVIFPSMHALAVQNVRPWQFKMSGIVASRETSAGQIC